MLPRACLLSLMLLISAAAHADIYGYVDDHGDAHFATEKLDRRYQLFTRDHQAFDSSMLASPGSTTPLFRLLSQHPNLKKYDALLQQAAHDFNLDPALLKAVMAAESGFNPTAVSPKGAIGLMQLMPATAERFGLQADRKRSIEKKLTDPRTNIRLAARYLSFLHGLFPNQQHLVLASYNAGEAAVQKYNNAIPPYEETRNYVKLVSQFYQLYQPATRSADNTMAPASDAKRIHMIIPGRRDMPTESLTSIE